jgi:hypothetical protein
MTTTIAKSRQRQAAAPTTWRHILPIHPANDLLPPMGDVELRELGEDIKRHGLQSRITIIVDKEGVERLLDGRSRLDAMERVGLRILTEDLELDRAVVPVDLARTDHISDPYAFVLSANVHRRHLTTEQRREVTGKLLKAKPNQSDRTIAKQVKVDHKTVGSVREDLESRGEIPHAKTRTDTKGRQQPAKKEKTQKTKTAEVKEAEPAQQKTAAKEQEPEAPFSTKLHNHFNELWALCQVKANWPPLSANREARLKKALKQLWSVRFELIELAKRAVLSPRRPMRPCRDLAAGCRARLRGEALAGLSPPSAHEGAGRQARLLRGNNKPGNHPTYWRVPDRNIGVPTGTVSGFWALDVDGADGEETLRDLEVRHGSLPRTREAITARESGGRHLWFGCTGPIPSTAGNIGPGLDTKGDGGYVVVPPSVHPSGRRYAWSSVDKLSAAPEWLVKLARAKPQSTISERAVAGIRRPSCKYGLAALEREIETLAATATGGRNSALNVCAFRLFQLVAGGELDRDLVIDRLIDASHRNGLVGDDGLRSVNATIASGMRAGLQHPRSRGAS